MYKVNTCFNTLRVLDSNSSAFFKDGTQKGQCDQLHVLWYEEVSENEKFSTDVATRKF